MRFATYSVITIFLLATIAAATWPADSIVAQDDPFGSGGNSQANPFGTKHSSKQKTDKKHVAKKSAKKKTKTVAKLEAKIRKALKLESSFEYDKTAFVEVMDELEKKYKFNVLLHSSAKNDSLTEDTQITFRKKGLPLSSSLNLLLKPHNATYMIKDGVLKIISLDVANDPENFSKAIIDCRTLIRLIAQQQATKLGQPANGKKPAEVNSTLLYIAEDKLDSLVRSTIDPDGWDDTNGYGTLQMLDGVMVVFQKHAVLIEIRELIDGLTKKLSSK